MSSGSVYVGNDGEGAMRVVPRTFVDDPHLVLLDRPATPLAERYRRLRLRMEQGTEGFPYRPQMTVITSAVPGEGKSTTAINLALAYAEDKKCRTLLIDADLRRPSVSDYIAPKPTLGLSGVLAASTPLDDALVEMSDTKVWVLPSGPPSASPLELLQRKELGKMIVELRSRFDRIVIDAPPTVPFTDAAVLALHSDGALLVVRAGTTSAPLIRRARESLAGTNVLGVVLNDVEFTAIDKYYYRYDDDEPGVYAYPQKQPHPA
jgi:capsular exopolysaccharide synthesis family protein